MKRILFLTSTNLASNPRLVKEMKLAVKHGFNIKLIQFYTGNWSDEMTDKIKHQFPEVEFTELSALRKPFFPWLLSSVLQKIYSLLPVRIMSTSMLSVAAGKRSLLLLQQVKKIHGSFDWVIAHNPAAFYPAYWYAKKRGATLGIDVEDYHPGETNDPKAAAIIKKLMQAVLPAAAYCSYAAPLIAAAVQRDIPAMQHPQLTVLNGFDGTEFPAAIPNQKETLQLVWFSQHIDAGRGLEQIIPVVNQLYPAVELHLAGNLKDDFANRFLQNKTGIHLHAPMPQKKLHEFLTGFDIGLAADVPVNQNRELALTNKILAYAQAGLLIVATNTASHVQFLESGDLDYRIVDGSAASYRQVFKTLIAEKESIRKQVQSRYDSGRRYDAEKLYDPLFEQLNNKV